VRRLLENAPHSPTSDQTQSDDKEPTDCSMPYIHPISARHLADPVPAARQIVSMPRGLPLGYAFEMFLRKWLIAKLQRSGGDVRGCVVLMRERPLRRLTVQNRLLSWCLGCWIEPRGTESDLQDRRKTTALSPRSARPFSRDSYAREGTHQSADPTFFFPALDQTLYALVALCL
jgi:hypothetical protein